MYGLDFFAASNRPWQLIKTFKTKLWLQRLTQLTVGKWSIDMSHFPRVFSCKFADLFLTYKCTRKPLFVVDKIFFGRLIPEDIQYCHS